MNALASKTATVAYIRVSTEKQADFGASLPAQQAKIEAYAQLYDLDLVKVIVDPGVSAKTLDRPGLQQALTMLRSGEAKALLVMNLDRLTRSLRDWSALMDEFFAKPGGPILLSITEQLDARTPSGRAMLSMLSVMAQWQREETAERTHSTLRYLASQGQYIGGRVPFGCCVVDKKVVPDSSEIAVASRARRLAGQGLSLRQISRAMAADGVLSRVGRPFGAMQVSRMLA